jgi:hypothetical protein
MRDMLLTPFIEGFREGLQFVIDIPVAIVAAIARVTSSFVNNSRARR